MTEHYLNTLTVRLRGYTKGYPTPENLAEEIYLEVTIGTELDLDELTDEIVRQDLRSGSRRIHQTYSATSWGASGSGAELLIDVPTMVSGVASMAMLWDLISRRILRHGSARVLDAQTQVLLTRDMLAQSLNVGADSIKIVDLERTGDSHRLECETPVGVFEVKTGIEGVTHMRRRQ